MRAVGISRRRVVGLAPHPCSYHDGHNKDNRERNSEEQSNHFFKNDEEDKRRDDSADAGKCESHKRQF